MEKTGYSIQGLVAKGKEVVNLAKCDVHSIVDFKTVVFKCLLHGTINAFIKMIYSLPQCMLC